LYAVNKTIFLRKVKNNHGWFIYTTVFSSPFSHLKQIDRKWVIITRGKEKEKNLRFLKFVVEVE